MYCLVSGVDSLFSAMGRRGILEIFDGTPLVQLQAMQEQVQILETGPNAGNG